MESHAPSYVIDLISDEFAPLMPCTYLTQVVQDYNNAVARWSNGATDTIDEDVQLLTSALDLVIDHADAAMESWAVVKPDLLKMVQGAVDHDTPSVDEFLHLRWDRSNVVSIAEFMSDAVKEAFSNLGSTDRRWGRVRTGENSPHHYYNLVGGFMLTVPDIRASALALRSTLAFGIQAALSGIQVDDQPGSARPGEGVAHDSVTDPVHVREWLWLSPAPSIEPLFRRYEPLAEALVQYRLAVERWQATSAAQDLHLLQVWLTSVENNLDGCLQLADYLQNGWESMRPGVEARLSAVTTAPGSDEATALIAASHEKDAELQRLAGDVAHVLDLTSSTDEKLPESFRFLAHFLAHADLSDPDAYRGYLAEATQAFEVVVAEYLPAIRRDIAGLQKLIRDEVRPFLRSDHPRPSITGLQAGEGPSGT